MNLKKVLASMTPYFLRSTLLVLGLIVFLVRLVLFPLLSPLQYPTDPEEALRADNWGCIARNIAEGHGYVLPYHGDSAGQTLSPNAARGPVPVLWFAGIFALFGYKLWPVVIGNWLLDVGTAIVIFQLSQYIFPHRRGVAILATCLYAFYVPEIWTSCVAFSESIFTLLLMLHLLTLVHLLDRPSSGKAVVAGLWLGLAVLARPIMLVFPAVIFGLMLFRYRRAWPIAKYFGALVLTFMFILSPWVIRNYLTFDAFVPGAAQVGLNLILENYYLDSPNYLKQLVPYSVIEAEIERLLNEGGDSLTNYNVAERDKIYAQEALVRIIQHPGRYFVASVNRLIYLWFYEDFIERPQSHSWTMTAGVAGIHTLLLLMAVVSLTCERHVRMSSALPIWLIILFFTFIHALIHAQPRFIVPVIPSLMLLAAPAIHSRLVRPGD